MGISLGIMTPHIVVLSHPLVVLATQNTSYIHTHTHTLHTQKNDEGMQLHYTIYCGIYFYSLA